MKKKKVAILIVILLTLILTFITIKFDLISRIKKLGGNVSGVVMYQKYNPGDIIYFDPVSDNECSESTFNLNDVINKTSTCYKWRVISTNDSTSNQTVSIQLDHNLINNSEWTNQTNCKTENGMQVCTESGPDKALSALATETSSWTKVPLLNYTYDTTLGGTISSDYVNYPYKYTYGVLSCTNGDCKTTKDGNDKQIATNVRARMITGEEVRALTMYAGAAASTNADNWTIASNHDGYFYFSNTDFPLGTNSYSSGGSTALSWLVENTDGPNTGESDWRSKSTKNIYGLSNYGYWTMSLLTNYTSGGEYVWHVWYDGDLYYSAKATLSNGLGIRPVIEYQKDVVQVKVTFNDDNRITDVNINKGNSVTAIANQGKTGWTFSHWSLTKKGSSFDFNTAIMEDTVLYAVYIKDGCESSIEQTGVEFLEDKKANGATDLAYDDNADRNLRYYGSSSNNYISFNDELWRIIGVFNVENSDGTKEKRVKIIRSDPLLTNVSYDSTPYDALPINGGMGINEWSQADLMKVLNPGFNTNIEETFTKVDSTTYTSNGNNLVNNSLYWNRTNGVCLSGQYNQTVSCNFSSTGIKDEYKDYIDTVKWNTASLPSDTSSLTAYQLYDIERGSTTAKTESYSKNYTTGVDDEVSRSTSWVGKIGLPYATDYIFSCGDHAAVAQTGMTRDVCLKNPNNYQACTSTNSWFGNYPQFVLSPKSGNLNTGALMSVGMSQVIISADSVITRPALYLTTDTIIYEDTNGSGVAGTSSNPYKIKKKTKCYVTVTYNDENRITTRNIELGTKAEEISSQGKSGEVFKFWSKNQTTAYDFNDAVEDDITLYAVYEKNTSNIRICEVVTGTNISKTFTIYISGDIDSSISLSGGECKTIRLSAGTYNFNQQSTAYFNLVNVTGDITSNNSSLTTVPPNDYEITFTNSFVSKGYMHSFGRIINEIGGE